MKNVILKISVTYPCLNNSTITHVFDCFFIRIFYFKKQFLYDKPNNIVTLEVDGKAQEVKFGSIIDVEKSFLVKDANHYRINVIGYTNKSKIETNIIIKKTQIAKRFSVDKKGQVYRVEYYIDKKFAGMILVKFKS